VGGGRAGAWYAPADGLEEDAMALRAMSADSHMDLIYLPPDTFTTRMDPAFGDRIPRVVERDGRKVWVSGQSVLGPYAFYGPGVAGGRRGRILAEAGFASGKETRPSNPAQRRQDQERDGVEAEIIYGILGISRGLFTNQGISDHETLTAVYHAYNAWAAEFARSIPGRFYPLGCLPNHDAALAAAELRHCASLGLKGAVFVPWGSAMPVWHEMWEPLWTAAEETGLVVSFHVFEGGGATVGYEVKGIRRPDVIGSWTVVAPMQMDEILVSLILCGVCERHPRLRLVLGESGIGWIPYVLERLDDTYEERLADDLGLPLPPSAYFKRQIYATFQKDFHGVQAMARIAPDNVMWGSDYPHRDGTWPFSQKVLEDQFREVPEAVARRMVWENVRRVYRIED
jgi:predicted TIM-barrel fold metal-dependent hydrolase